MTIDLVRAFNSFKEEISQYGDYSEEEIIEMFEADMMIELGEETESPCCGCECCGSYNCKHCEYGDDGNYSKYDVYSIHELI